MNEEYSCPVCSCELVTVWGNKERLTCLQCNSAFDKKTLEEYSRVYTTYTEDGD